VHEQFGFQMITECPGVSALDILKPWETWDNVAAYRQAANKLARSFQHQFAATYRDNPEAMKLYEMGPSPV
jgi:ATP-dependent phosphoenolpyruvate carboxykinase